MKKFLKIVSILLLVSGAFWMGTVFADRQTLADNLIRLHVVADSDAATDQAIKLQVRDAILSELETVMDRMPDLETAKAYLQDNLGALEERANDVLKKAKTSCQAVVTLAKEAFPTRQYETFTLPAGIYESLRVTIGSGQGQNWWCVVFPRLCVSATADQFEDTAVSAGFSDHLAGTLTGKQEYRVRFFLLDCIGWIENWIFEKDF